MLTEHEKSMLMVNLVNRYMTPFAALLVLSAAFLSPTPGKVSAVAVLILAVAWVMNVTTPRIIARLPEKAAAVRKARVVVNYVFDLALIWIFMPHWPSIWLLFLLTIIAVGAYEDKRTVVQHAVLLTVMLCVVSGFRGGSAVPGGDRLAQWGDLGIKTATLWFSGLFTNRLVASLQ